MSTLTTETHSEAVVIAEEIRQAAHDFKGKKWCQVGGEERPVQFAVFSPTLAATELRARPSCEYSEMENFRFKLYDAGGEYVDGRRRGRILHSWHVCRLEFERATSERAARYTGYVVIQERSFDYDM